MKLNALPKDLLVELVSELQDRKEKEYSEYILIYANGLDTRAFHFNTETELKTFIFLRVLYYQEEIVFDNKNIWLFVKSLRQLPFEEIVEYCKNKVKALELNKLVAVIKNISDKYVIVKGKVLTENGNEIAPMDYLKFD